MNQMKIFTKDNLTSLKCLKEVSDNMMYIYVILNEQNLIKIGKTTNPLQRIKSLSGSNSGGFKICKIACLQNPTYILTLENTLHNHYDKYRISGTEWFKDLDFYDVIEYINNLLSLPSYDICNNLRKQNLKK